MMIPSKHIIPTPYIVGDVHCYSAEIDGEGVLFDCGPPTEECREFLRKNIDLSRLRHLLLTHGHIDHWGQALWLAQEYGVTVYMPYHDHLKIIHSQQRLNALEPLLQKAGFAEEWLATFSDFVQKDAIYSDFPIEYCIAEDEVEKRLQIRVHNCPGHSTSDLVYEGCDRQSDKRWIVSGDTILQGVFQSPLLDIDLEHGGRFHNYEKWCQSLVTLARLEGSVVLPGHRQSAKSIYSVLLWYIRTLLYRIKRFLPYRNEENLANAVTAMLADRIQGIFHIYFKASEMIFIKDCLADPQKLIDALDLMKMIIEKADRQKQEQQLEPSEFGQEIEKILFRFRTLLASLR